MCRVSHLYRLKLSNTNLKNKTVVIKICIFYWLVECIILFIESVLTRSCFAEYHNAAKHNLLTKFIGICSQLPDRVAQNN